MNIDITRRPPLPTVAAPRCATGGSQRLSNFRSWKDFVHDNFPWLEHRDHSDGGFKAEVRAGYCSGASLSAIHADASEVIRTRQLADAAEVGYIKLLWQRSGSLKIEQDGRRCVLAAGEVAVCDTTRPYRVLLSERTSFLVLMLDHQAMPGWRQLSQQVCGTRLVDCASTRGAFGALLTLVDLSDDRFRTEGDPVVRAVRWMLGAALQHSVGRLPGEGADDARIAQARRHIERHIDDPGLDADTLAAALCMSRRSLYTLLGRQGQTPTRMINELRLDQAFQQLQGVGPRQCKITELAFDLGFSDYATFSRLFKARFGVSPNEHRQRGACALTSP